MMSSGYIIMVILDEIKMIVLNNGISKGLNLSLILIGQLAYCLHLTISRQQSSFGNVRAYDEFQWKRGEKRIDDGDEGRDAKCSPMRRFYKRRKSHSEARVSFANYACSGERLLRRAFVSPFGNSWVRGGKIKECRASVCTTCIQGLRRRGRAAGERKTE